MVTATINEGAGKSYGLFFVEYLQLFQGSVSVTAIISAILTITHVVVSKYRTNTYAYLKF